jgi:hypothetical protein
MKKLFIFLTLITLTSSLNMAYANEDLNEDTLQADELDQRVVIDPADIGDNDTVYDPDPVNHKEDNKNN